LQGQRKLILLKLNEKYTSRMPSILPLLANHKTTIHYFLMKFHLQINFYRITMITLP
jgi:hypothetical protein